MEMDIAPIAMVTVGVDIGVSVPVVLDAVLGDVAVPIVRNVDILA